MKLTEIHERALRLDSVSLDMVSMGLLERNHFTTDLFTRISGEIAVTGAADLGYDVLDVDIWADEAKSYTPSGPLTLHDLPRSVVDSLLQTRHQWTPRIPAGGIQWLVFAAMNIDALFDGGNVFQAFVNRMEKAR